MTNQTTDPKWNPPDRDTLRYSTGTAVEFVERMRARLHQEMVSNPDGPPHAPLARLNTDIIKPGKTGNEGFGMALVQSWAAVCDILSFYQERFANEGYLRTASDPRSVFELTSMLGYQPHPGLAASTLISFTLNTAKSSPEVVHIDPGLTIGSIPPAGAMPQYFETTTALEARGVWNEFKPLDMPATRTQELWGDTNSIMIIGTGTGLKAGDSLLLTGVFADNPRELYIKLKKLVSVKLEGAEGYTILTWKNLVDAPENGRHIKKAAYTSFHAEASLFGFNAMPWPKVPESTRMKVRPVQGGVYRSMANGQAWESIQGNLPQVPILSLAIGSDGRLFAGLQGRGIFSSQDGGLTWLERNTGLSNRDVFTLAFDNRGGLLAGTGGGGVFYSKNNGASWEAKKGGFTLDKKGKAKKASLPETTIHGFVVFSGKAGVSFWRKTADAFKPKNLASLFKPQSLVKLVKMLRGLNPAKLVSWLAKQLRKLVASERDRIRELIKERLADEDAFPDPEEQTFVMAGTDMGVFRTPGTLDGWHPVNEGMPRVNTETGTAEVAVHALAYSREIKLMFAGTDHGIFYSGDLGASWRPTNKGMPRTDDGTGWSHTEVLSLLVVPAEESRTPTILAGTRSGVFRSTDSGASWEASGEGLPMVDTSTGLPRVHIYQIVRSPVAPYDVFAGTDYGLFVSKNGGSKWTQLNNNLLVLQFVVRGKSRTESYFDPIAVDLDRGHLPEKLREHFKENGSELSVFTRIEPLENGSKWLFLDDARGTGYLVKRAGEEMEVFIRANYIPALAPDLQGGVLAATSFSGFEDEEWPGFWIHGRTIDLDRVYPDILPGSTVVLQENELLAVRDIVQVMTVTRTDFNIESTVTRLVVDNEDLLKLFNLRTTRVLLKSAVQQLYEPHMPAPEPVAGSRITLDRLVTGLPENRLLVVSGKRKRARIGRTGGVFVYNEDWTRIGLPNLHVFTLVRDVQGLLVAGTSDGVFQLREGGDGWEWVSLGLDGLDVHALCSDHYSNDLFAGVHGLEDNTLFRRTGDDWVPLEFRGRDIAAMGIYQQPGKMDLSVFGYRGEDNRTDRRILYIATRKDGVWASLDHGATFRNINVGLTCRHTTCLEIHPSGSFLLLGTEEGVFVSTDHGGHWRAWNQGLDNLEVQGMDLDTKRRLAFVATRGGVFAASTEQLHRPGAWVAMSQGLTEPILWDVMEADGIVYAATKGGGVFYFADERRGWKPMPIGLSNDVRCLCIDRRRRVVAGAMAHVLMGDAQETVTLRLSHLFDLKPEDEEAEYVFVDLIRRTFKKHQISLSKDTVVVPGEELKSWIIDDGPEKRFIFYRELGLLRIYQPLNRMMVVHAPAERSDGLQVWNLVTDRGFSGKVAARPGEILLDPSFDDDKITSEPVILSRAGATNDSKHSVLFLAEPMANVYDLPTVKILGNVVPATHGQTARQTLGSGDSTKAGQTFILRENALTYRPLPNGGYHNTLNIHINPDKRSDGILWEQVGTLFDQPSGRRCYSLRRDGEGNIVLHFGDGAQGARLPTGVENVLATYRKGIGIEGNVEVDTLLMPQQRPLGVDSVTNPVPAAGGATRESWDSARTRAPIQTRPLNRIVSLGDLEDFVLLYPGIAKTRAGRVWNGHRNIGHLSFAAEKGEVISKNSATFKHLLETVNHASGKMLENVVMDSYEQMHFCIEAGILLEPGAHKALTPRAVVRDLLKHYSFENRQFGQDVTQAEVITFIQDVKGVAAVTLRALHLEGTRRMLLPKLDAAYARWDAKQQDIAAAQILFIQNESAIRIEVL
ncbi:MAG: hypothetical protein QNK37_14250 [Acidobacteriota bacterium]|nr:hypothetical protein [Acidobacteriota bacterium]